MPSIPNGGGSKTSPLRRLSSNPEGRLDESDWNCCEANNNCGIPSFGTDGLPVANAGPFDNAIHSPKAMAPNSRRDAPRAESVGTNSWMEMNARTAMRGRKQIRSGYNPYLGMKRAMITPIL